MKRLPAASTSTSSGVLSKTAAALAGPLSPAKELVIIPGLLGYLPTIVEMYLVEAEIMRMTLLYVSAMYIFPAASTVTPRGWCTAAPMAREPSPLYPPPEAVLVDLVLPVP